MPAAALRAACVFVVTLLFAQVAAAIEEPAYTSVLHDDALEIRDYAPYLVAETRVEANFDDAGNQAFRRLFDYISGANRQQQSIGMTAPVLQREGSEGTSIAMTAPVRQVAEGTGYRVAFVVPRKFDRNSVPVPTDPRVSIREVPAQRMAAWRFSGRWTEQAFKDAEARLRAAIVRLGYEATGPAVVARYNAPFSLPFTRRNEVLLPVRLRSAR
jgi:hypothetical protein